MDSDGYPDVNHWECRPQSYVDGVWMPIHSDPDENGRCVRCGVKSWTALRAERDDLGSRRDVPAR